MNVIALSIFHEYVKAVHTVPRANGDPYWVHPIRCHQRLMWKWESAPQEVQIAMLFHDTLEDVQDGEAVIREALEAARSLCSDLDDCKVFTLVRNLTTPDELSKMRAIQAIEQRYLERRVEPEAYLLKTIDILDNTTDLLDCYRQSPGEESIQRHMTDKKLQKYTGYINSIRYGLNGNEKFRELFTVELHTAMSSAICDVKLNLNRMADLLGVDLPEFPRP